MTEVSYLSSIHLIRPRHVLRLFPRSSAGKSGKPFGRWGSLKDRERHNTLLAGGVAGLRPPQHNPARLSADSDSGTECVQTFQRAALYILGEKAHVKVTLYLQLIKYYISLEYLQAFKNNKYLNIIYFVLLNLYRNKFKITLRNSKITF